MLNEAVIGDFSAKIRGLSEKPRYAAVSPLKTIHPTPDMHSKMENIRLWLYNLNPLFAETIILKFMSNNELAHDGWFKFYFDGVRLFLYVDVNIGRRIVNEEIIDSLFLAKQAIGNWYEEYKQVASRPVKYSTDYVSKRHSLAMCELLRHAMPVEVLCKEKVEYAETYINCRIAVVNLERVDDDVFYHLNKLPDYRWYYSSGTFVIHYTDFTKELLEQLRREVELSIATTRYWVERLLTY